MEDATKPNPDKEAEEPVLEPKPPLGSDEKPEENPAKKTITVPGPRTESGKDETYEVEEDKPTSLSTASTSYGDSAPQYKTVDFGKAGKLKLEAAFNPHNGLGGAEYDVLLRVGDNQTHALTNVPARYLSE